MKRAYVTTISNGDGYLPGAEVLGRSLQHHCPRVGRVALVTADVSNHARGQLTEQGWQLREVEPLDNPSHGAPLMPRFANVFTKLRAWTLVDLERVVLLDCDTIVLQNVDDLFERRGFAAAPDFFLPDHFNSGVMVLEPSNETFRKMLAALATSSTYDGGDQGFLNTFFANWYAMPVEHRLPVGYNMANFIYQFLHGHPSLRAALERDVKILHYMVQKPWRSSMTLTGGSTVWWDTFFELHPELASAWKRDVHLFEDRTFDRVVSALLGSNAEPVETDAAPTVR